MSAFLHLTSCEGALVRVREALELIPRDDEVIAVTDEDCLTVGSLHDVDSGAKCRVAWWNRVLGEDHGRLVDDRAMWNRVRDDERPVVVWNSPDTLDRLLALRACWWLRSTPQRVYEICMPPKRKGPLPAFFAAVALSGPEQLVAHWKDRARVADVAARACEWDDCEVGRTIASASFGAMRSSSWLSPLRSCFDGGVRRHLDDVDIHRRTRAGEERGAALGRDVATA